MTTVPTRTYPDLDRRDPSLPVEHIIQPTITIKCPYEYGRSNGWQARVTWRTRRTAHRTACRDGSSVSARPPSGRHRI